MAGKMRLPKKATIGGFTFTIEYPAKYTENHVDGQCHSLYQRIKINDKSKNGDVYPNQYILQTLLHEGIHAVDSIFTGWSLVDEENDDYIIDPISMALYQVLRDNKLDLKSEKMPKKIIVGPTEYEVISNHTFESSARENLGLVDNCNCKIKLASTQDGGSLHVEYINSLLIYCIIRAIVHNYNIPERFETLVNQRSFANGIYQMLISIDAEGLIEKWVKK